MNPIKKSIMADFLKFFNINLYFLFNCHKTLSNESMRRMRNIELIILLSRDHCVFYRLSVNYALFQYHALADVWDMIVSPIVTLNSYPVSRMTKAYFADRKTNILTWSVKCMLRIGWDVTIPTILLMLIEYNNDLSMKFTMSPNT